MAKNPEQTPSQHEKPQGPIDAALIRELDKVFSDPIRTYRLLNQHEYHLSDEEIQSKLDAMRKPGEPEPWPFNAPRKSDNS